MIHPRHARVLLTLTAMLAMLAIAILTLTACTGEGTPPRHIDLSPTENPFAEDPRHTPGPQRLKPTALAIHPDGDRLFLAITGTPDHPGQAVLELHLDTHSITHHAVGSGPTALAMHPDGRYLVVANRFSNYLSILDLERHRVRRAPADFYTEALLFDATGDRLFLANRWKNHVELRPFDATGRPAREALETFPVGFNPARLHLSPDERTLYAASIAGLAVAAIDLHTAQAPAALTGASPVEVHHGETAPPAFADWAAHPRVRPLWTGAPAFAVATTDDHLYVATLSESTHHPPGLVPDDHPYGAPSTGFANQGFNALQNEIALYDRRSLAPLTRYTSADICCPDVRDITPDDPERGHLLPPDDLWIVEGSLPIDIAIFEDHLLVLYAGTGSLQRFYRNADGTLRPGPIADLGHDPRHLLVDPSRRRAYVANRLSDTLSIVDLDTLDTPHLPLTTPDTPPFPANDRELGEALYYTATLSVGRGVTCNHCHFDRGNIGKFFSMPFLKDPRGSRITPDTRGLFDSRPWFLEAAMDDHNFTYELGELLHLDNFPADDPEAHRDAFISARTAEHLGAPLTFTEATRNLATYLVHEPALLPTPYAAPNAPSAVEAQRRRGELLFHSPETGCAACHVAPAFHSPRLLGPVIDPPRTSGGTNLSLLSQDFLTAFPDATHRDGDVLLKSTSLRGLWDRAPGYYHDGRARTLKEALLTPGHPALQPWERGYNTADGIIDTHGSTSHLTPAQIDDLLFFLLTL